LIYNPHYDIKELKRYAMIMIAMVALLKVTMGFAAGIMLVMVFVSISRRKMHDLVFWVLFMTMTSVGNHKIFSTNFITMMTVRASLILMIMAVLPKVFNAGRSRVTKPFFGLLFYLFWEALISVQGYSPIISYLKLGLFICIFFAFIGVANTVNMAPHVDMRKLRSAVLGVVALMVLGSVALIPFPSIGMMAADREMIIRMQLGEMVNLFCGMCGHSQALGPVMGVLGTFILADLVFSIKRWDRLYLALFIACPLVIYRTSSRTGMGTFLAGVLFVGFMLMQSRGVNARWKGKVLSSFLMLGILGVGAAAVVPSIRMRVAKYALKWTSDASREEVTVEGMFSSRQKLIDRALYNYRKKPMTGNGFQVSDDMVNQRRRGFLSYLSAPIEKGVWIYAVLEEGGAPGMIFFAGWLLAFFSTMMKRRAYVASGTFFAFVMSNTGEFTIFAMTYMGGFLWTISVMATTLDAARMKDDARRRAFGPYGYVG